MADKVTVTSELKLVAKFKDGDTRTITVDNPKSDLTAAQINAVSAIAASSNPIIGDKGGAAFHEFDTAEITRKTKTDFDLR